MHEYCEFRVVEEYAYRLFAENEGKRLGDTIRKIELMTSDPRFVRVGELQREFRTTLGRSFFHGWILRRSYTKTELAAADCFRWFISTAFEPSGEECGTKYDETTACPNCGTGAKQVSELFLDWKRIPKNKDVARTIAGEVVVSARLVELFHQQGVSGVEFRAIRQNPATDVESKEWFHLIIQSSDANIVFPTRTGIDPFDDDAGGQYRCKKSDLIGLNILSEVTVEAATRGAADIVCTRQFVGLRRGLLRPVRIILISGRVWRLLVSKRLQGWNVEVAHIC
jgi:hypothetical protein